jgi:hypothetical protein
MFVYRRPSKMETQTPRRKIIVKKGETSIPPIPITGASMAYTASLLMLFQHVADIHMSLLEIIEEKYGHSMDEMVSTVIQHPKWKNMQVNPVIHDLTMSCIPSSPAPLVATPTESKKVILRRKILRPQKADPP